MGDRGRVTALILGSAACKAEDEEAARQLFAPDILIAVNHAARDHPGPVDHWASYHAEFFPKWTKERAALGYEPAGALWTGERRVIVPGMKVQRVRNWGGSSGLLAVVVAIELGVTHGVLAGIPLDAHQGHYDAPGKKWSDGGNYRKGWLDRLDHLGCFRSMSGLTRHWLGAPTAEWFDGTDEACNDQHGALGGGANDGRSRVDRPARRTILPDPSAREAGAVDRREAADSPEARAVRPARKGG